MTLDLRKQHSKVYAATARPALAQVPPLRYLTVDGEGDPDGPECRAAMQALYSVSYGIRALMPEKHVVMPLQGLWWGPDGHFDVHDRASWQWRLMILQPETVTADVLERARRAKPSALAARLELRDIEEGQVAQVLHLGPYADEKATIDRLLAFIEEQGLRLAGQHHEIYLSNPQRTAPEKLRTIIRYPVA